jgi:hypothetical protein
MNAIMLKLFACTKVGCSSIMLPPNDNISSNRSQSSSESADVNSNTTNENVRITLVPFNCNVCVRASVSDSRNLPASSNVSPHAPGSCLTPTELSLPYFDDSSKIITMYHLKQLDEYSRTWL